jgi:signal transduction histidine kinase
LFQNSYQAKKENCEILIKTEIIKKKVIIYVRDKGKGISEKLIKNIFEPFNSTKEDGLGIGLAFVSEVIKNHNGSIRVDSELGKGTAFTLLLPVYD